MANSTSSSTMRWLVNLLLIVAMGLLLTGFFAPMMTLEKFVFVSNTLSLLGGIRSLWEAREIALAVSYTHLTLPTTPYV